MEKLFLIPQQGAVFLTLLGIGVALGAWWQLLSWIRRRLPALGVLWDALFALSLGGGLLGVLLRWREEQLRLYALLGVLLGVLIYLLGPGSAATWLARRLHGKKHAQDGPPRQENPHGRAKHSSYNATGKAAMPAKPSSPAAPAFPQSPERKGEVAHAGQGDALDEAGADLCGGTSGVFCGRPTD